MQKLKGQKAIVTAAGQGIGRAAALALQAEGAKVLATDMNLPSLAEIADRVSWTAQLDVTDTPAVAALVSEYGPFGLLFNCAGVVHSGTLLAMTDDDLATALKLNVVAMAEASRAVLPGMIEAGGGAIINMSSVASSIKGVPNRAAYSISKAAVLGLTKSIAADFVGQNIRCNAICPGTVDSPSLQGRLREGGDYEATRKAFVARQPMGRIGTPEEISDLVVHLACATYTTGQAYAIDGGWTI